MARFQSKAIAEARRIRRIGAATLTEQLSPTRLHSLSDEDATDLLARWRGEEKGGAALEVALHMDEAALSAAIYRHALIEAGAMVDVHGEPFDPCPPVRVERGGVSWMEDRWRDAKAKGADVELPTDEAELHRLALEVICSKGVPSHLTPYGSIRAVAAFAIGKQDDAFYTDGETLLRAAVADRSVAE